MTEMVTVIVDGEEQEVSRDAYNDVVNNDKWKATQHDRDAELKAEANTLKMERENIAEERRLMTIEKQMEIDTNHTEEIEVADANVALDMSDVPNMLDDPDGYTDAIERKILEATQKGIDIARGEIAEKTQSSEARAVGEAARQSAFAKNDATVNEYFKENPDINADEKASIRSTMNTMLRNKDYGAVDSKSEVFMYNEGAVKFADEMVRKDHYRQATKDEGYQEGLSQLEKGSNASQYSGHASSGRTHVGKNASAEEIYNIASELPAGSKAAEQLMENLSDEQLDNYLSHSVDMAEQGLGA